MSASIPKADTSVFMLNVRVPSGGTKWLEIPTLGGWNTLQSPWAILRVSTLIVTTLESVL